MAGPPGREASCPPDEYESAACGLLTLAPGGAIERVNRTFCGWTGYAAGELVGRLAQVVTNLANNALTSGTPDEPVTITTEVADGALDVRMHNAGSPVSEELRPHIFGPQRRDEQQVGLGSRSVELGLRRVAAHSAVAPDEASMQEIEAWGEPAFVLVPNGYHRLDTPAYKRATRALRCSACGGRARRSKRSSRSTARTTRFRAGGGARLEHLEGAREAEGVTAGSTTKDNCAPCTDAVRIRSRCKAL